MGRLTDAATSSEVGPGIDRRRLRKFLSRVATAGLSDGATGYGPRPVKLKPPFGLERGGRTSSFVMRHARTVRGWDEQTRQGLAVADALQTG
jgi:hypothetical protein